MDGWIYLKFEHVHVFLHVLEDAGAFGGLAAIGDDHTDEHKDQHAATYNPKVIHLNYVINFN